MTQSPDPLTLSLVLGLLVLGFLAGGMSGLIGIGGGIVIVPALVFLFGLTQHQAQGTTLALLMFPIGILGALQYYRDGHVDFRFVGLLAAGFVLGGYFGGKLAVDMPAEMLRKIFAVILIAVALKLLLSK